MEDTPKRICGCQVFEVCPQCDPLTHRRLMSDAIRDAGGCGAGNEPSDNIHPVPGMKQFESGARSTVVKPRYDLVPQITVELIAERHEYGANRHGEWNYLKGANDPVFIRDRKNHLVEHALNYARYGKRSDLAAILCNGSMLAELRAFVDDEEGKVQR